MRWLYALFAASIVLMIALAQIFFWLGVLGLMFWAVMGESVRCPRCRRHVMDNGRGYHAPWIKTPERCIGCDRQKDDIWPFQWLLRPERSSPSVRVAPPLAFSRLGLLA